MYFKFSGGIYGTYLRYWIFGQPELITGLYRDVWTTS
jgi:hypothetical protein